MSDAPSLGLARSPRGVRVMIRVEQESSTPQPGDFLALHPSDDASLVLVQVHDVVDIDGDGDADNVTGRVVGALDAAGEATSVAGFTGVPVRRATADDVARVLGTVSGADLLTPSGRLRIGVIGGVEPTIPALLHGKGLSRHTFVCGQSGSGKTYALGKLLEEILLQTDLRMFVLDANSDHVRLADRRCDDELDQNLRVQVGGPALDELVRRHDVQSAAIRVFDPAIDEATVDGRRVPLRIRFSNLMPEEQELVLGLTDDGAAGARLALKAVRSVLSDRYGIDDIRRVALEHLDDSSIDLVRRIDLSGVTDWVVWARSDAPTTIEAGPVDGRGGGVLDLGAIDPAERDLVHLGFLRLAWAQRHLKRPVLIVADEAHNLAPASPETDVQRAVVDVVTRIAAEGRKYGIHLLLATQRPSKLHPEVLSQCDNLVLLRMNGARDVEDIAATFSFVSEQLLQQAPDFRLGEAFVAGPLAGNGVVLPIRVGARLTPEGGSDVPLGWLEPAVAAP